MAQRRFLARRTANAEGDVPAGTRAEVPEKARDLRLPLAARIAGRVRGRHLLVADMASIVVAWYVSIGLRFGEFPDMAFVGRWWVTLPFLLVLRAFWNVTYGLYSLSWRHASLPEVRRILAAVLFGSVTALLLFYGLSGLAGVDWAPGFPRSIWLGEAIIAAMLFGGLRFSIRAALERPMRATHPEATSRPTLLYGAGHEGALMARSAARYPDAGVQPVGFLDDNPELAGTMVAGLRVFGDVEALPRAVQATGATSLLITMPHAPGAAVRRAVEGALALRLDVRTVPKVSDLLDGSVDAYRIRRVRVEDLLRRPMVTEHAAAVNDIIRDKVVVVTGAGGSIGSELARQVFAIGPRRLILVDRAESPLYMMQRELTERQVQRGGSTELHIHLANVASRAGMRRLVSAERPSVIFHAAAYKHVPMMEEHPSDGVHVNVGGTRALLEAAEAADVERFVLVSTDKAVRPSSAMGATKRIAEMLVSDAARRTGRPYVSVRFGNVLGSAGSVIPIFQEQLENGQPLTITHPDMTRFFMTIPEAAWLILDAAALGQTGDLFVLEMGEPVRIMDLARDLVRLAGRDPDTQPMVITGLRPGEKLHEELFYLREQVERTDSAKVLRVRTQAPPPTLADDVNHFVAMASGEHENKLRAALLAYVQEEVSAADALRPGEAASESVATVAPASQSTVI